MQQNFGTAQTKSGFILNEATLMICAMGAFLDATEDEHSVGLFKSLNVANEVSFQNLTQGLQQDEVDSVKTANNFTISGDLYEYNERTLKLALGQQGYTVDPTAAQVKQVTTAPAAIGEIDIVLGDVTGLTVGDWVILYTSLGNNDGLAYNLTAIDTGTKTVTLDRPLVVPVTIGDSFIKSALIQTSDPSSCSGVQYFSGKVVSATTGCKPIVMYIPKFKVTSGFNVAFGTADYSKMSFQITPMALTKDEAGYDFYKQHGKSKIIQLMS